MIYDCFAFFNELDLLKIRLHELNEVVDKFVLVEANRTFQKKEKPLFFYENKHLFKEFESKIIHLVVDKYPTFWNKFRVPTTWDYENRQREQILVALKDCKDDDAIIISDLDEIPRAEYVKKYAYTEGVKVFRQYQAYYFVNNICKKIYDYGGKAKAQFNADGFGWWQGSVMLSYKTLRTKVKTIKKARLQRDLPEPAVTILKEAGWHFSYMGGVEKIIEKLGAWSHKEFNTAENRNPEKIKKIIKEGQSLFYPDEKYELVDIEQTEIPFPNYLKNHLKEFEHLILKP